MSYLSMFGSWLAKSLVMNFALPFIASIVLLYMSSMNLIGFLLRKVNFPYLRLFQRFKFLTIAACVFFHMSQRLGTPFTREMVFVAAFASMSFVSIYLVDLAWKVGQEYQKANGGYRPVASYVGLSIVFGLFNALLIWYLNQHKDIVFVIYCLCVPIFSLMRQKSNLLDGMTVVLISCLVKYAWIERNTVHGWVINFALLFLAAYRQGIESETHLLGRDQDYPASSYLFFCAAQAYLYAWVSQYVPYMELVLGLIYLVTVIIQH